MINSSLWVSALDDEVKFTATFNHYPEQKAGLEQEPLEESFEIKELTWDKDMYSPTANNVIQRWVNDNMQVIGYDFERKLKFERLKQKV